MLLLTPVHFRRIERASGVRTTVARLTNTGDSLVEVQVARVRAPYWIDLGRVGETGEFAPLAASAPFALAAGAEVELTVRLDTAHPEFPEARASEEVLLELAAGEALALRVFLDEVAGARAPYHGVLAIDFGTSNTCYAWKDDEAFGAPRCSVEIPSAIFFKDLSDPDDPRVAAGAEAEHEIRERTHLVSAYFTSLKRALGGQPVRVIDPRGNTAWYTPERIAGFFLREVVTRARSRDLGGAPVARVVATFPPSFDQRRVAAVRKAFEHALGRTGEAAPQVEVALRLDEVSAAAFDYVHEKLHRAFRELKLERRSARLLAIDVGGGTTDAVALDVLLERRPRDATRIGVQLLGATGEKAYGGDEVTRALLELLQRRIALALAARLAPAGGEGAAPADGGASPLAEVLRALAARKDDDDEEDEAPARGRSGTQKRKRSPLASTLAELAAREGPGAAPVAAAPQGVERFACRDPERFRRALARIEGAKDSIGRACDEGASLAHVLGPDLLAEAEALEDALDTVVPVRPERHPEADPAREELEKALRCELWQEAERLKRRLSDRPTEALAPSGELARLARYASVDAGFLQRQVKVKLDELEAVVFPRIRAFLVRAKGLLDRLEPVAPATIVAPIVSGVEVSVDAEALRRRPEPLGTGGAAPAFAASTRPQVLLCGNGSRLPAVRRAVREVLAVGEDELAWAPARAKPMVAQGAAEEEAQRRHFGGEFLEVEVDGFVERLAYAIGLYHPDVPDAPGFREGFCEVFPRGARPGEARELTDENPLVHSALERLKVYASDLDGAPPRLLGKVDLASAPIDRVPVEGPGESFRLRFELGPNREVRVVDGARGTVHALELAP